MSNSLTDTISTLNKLIETCLDGQEGFRLAAEAITDDEDLKGFLFSASLQRSKFAGELQNEVIALGEPDPTHTNSVTSKVHRGWFNLKTALTGNDDHAILAECEKGEDSAVAAYRKALNSEMSSTHSEIVSRQFQEVLATHNSVRGMRDQLASQKPPARTAGQVYSDVQSSIKSKSQAFGASATDGWSDVRTKRFCPRSEWGLLLACWCGCLKPRAVTTSKSPFLRQRRGSGISTIKRRFCLSCGRWLNSFPVRMLPRASL